MKTKKLLSCFLAILLLCGKDHPLDRSYEAKCRSKRSNDRHCIFSLITDGIPFAGCNVGKYFILREVNI